jgi:hypothetical protein
MSQQYINIGSTANDGNGDPIRTAFQKTNNNFTQLFNGGGGANTGNITFDNVTIVGTGNLNLQPSPNTAGAFLDIFLTTGPDVHIAANGETVIIGRDDSANIAVTPYGNVTIQSYNGNASVWTFGDNGDLTLPTEGNLILAGGVIKGNGASPAPSINGFDTIGAIKISASGNISAASISAHGQIIGTYVPGSGTGSGILTQGANTQGGAGYFDFIKVVNQSGNVTNPNKTLRVDNTGNLQVVNSSYSQTLLNLTDAGELSVIGNVNTNYIFGNGTFLTGISGAGNPSANALTGNTLTANVTISSLTQLGTLGNLSVSGNTTSGNILTAGLISSTGNAQAGNILTAGVVSSTGNVNAGAFYTNTGNITTGAGVIKGPNVEITHQLTFSGPYGNAVIDTYANVSTTGTVIAPNFIGNLSNGNSKISIASSGNISFGIGPFSSTVLSVNTSTGISVSGNILASQSVSTVGNVYSNGNIAMVSNILRNTYVANVAPTSGQGNIGDIWYQTF